MNQLTPIIAAVFASSGFWALLTAIYTTRRAKKEQAQTADTAERELLLGLAHDRIYSLCEEYIAAGEITLEQYDNLLYIYKPYDKAGGNGTGRKLFENVEKLPMRKEKEKEKEKNETE